MIFKSGNQYNTGCQQHIHHVRALFRKTKTMRCYSSNIYMCLILHFYEICCCLVSGKSSASCRWKQVPCSIYIVVQSTRTFLQKEILDILSWQVIGFFWVLKSMKAF